MSICSLNIHKKRSIKLNYLRIIFMLLIIFLINYEVNYAGAVLIMIYASCYLDTSYNNFVVRLPSIEAISYKIFDISNKHHTLTCLVNLHSVCVAHFMSSVFALFYFPSRKEEFYVHKFASHRQMLPTSS